MFRFIKSKALIFTLVSSLLIMIIPLSLSSQESQTGNLTGVVYEEDGKTPVKDAIVTIKNITTNQEFSSQPTNNSGEYEIGNIPVGVYLIGVNVDKEKYNINALVEIKKEELANLSLILTKKKALLAGILRLACFFAHLVGGGIVIYKLVEEEEEVSPIK